MNILGEKTRVKVRRLKRASSAKKKGGGGIKGRGYKGKDGKIIEETGRG